MPPLDNIKWERFCQNIVCGVYKNGQKLTQGRAYLEAGYNVKGVGEPGGSAEVCASKLLNRAKIENRIAELLREAQDKLIKKRRYDIETISERMALASQIAEEDWPVPGSEDTELGVLMELEVGHGETEVYPRVQA
jgi:hypothetical protein